MIRLSTLLLAPPVGERLRARYDDYRQHGASWLSASLGCLWASLVWALMPLETPRWQAILARHETYFPHINPHRPRPLDPLRYLLQSLWLLTTRVPEPEKKVNWRSLAALEGVHGRYTQWLEKLPEQMNARTGHLDKQKELAHLNPKLRRAILGGVTFCSLVLALMCITQPFNPLSQFIFLMLLWGVALLVRRIPGRFSALMLIVLSLTVSCRYIWWRYTSTLNWNDPVSLVCGIILLFAETYAWVVLVLGYFQVVWPLNRQPVPLPEDMDLWPTVDIFVPTYNEDLNVVKNTIYASQGIDWPKDKLNIWILDDGGREAFRQFAKDVGVHYIARTSHEHAKAGSIVLRGSRPDASVEFGMRSDELVANALLNLEYTPSPSLLPVQSQLKVYLNDELMGVLPVTKEQLGKKIRAQLPIDPLYITDFNRVRLEFVGHYRDVCENPASSTLWLDVGRESYLDLTYQSLKVNNDLSHFPVPFYDPRDNRPLKLPMIFPGSPAVTQQQAAAIVASWFGSKAGWRGQQFPVYFNELPDRNAIVFATNDKRPDFLRDHPPVKAPTIEMIDNPNDPYVKLLVIFGRDDNDLLLAAKGIAQGNILFRGSSVTVDGIKTLQPRQPYDAPNWVRTDRSVTFAELKTYEQQLQSSGLVPDAITVALNLPPDLYLLRANGIDMDLKYRYTMPPVKDSSRMDISLNDQFLQSFSLNSSQDVNKLILRLPVLQGLLDGKSEVTIPALRLGAVNQLRFDFQYMNPMPGGSIDNCITFQPVQNHVVIGDDSTIDFSKYYHFIALPDLRVFANAGFPYSRMADLSDTLVVVPKAPTQGQVATLLQALGGIGSQTGLAAINLQMTDDGNQIKNKDADLLLIGAIPSSLKDDTKINLLVEATKSWVKMPMRHYDLASIYPDDEARTPNTRTDITSSGPMAAVIGFQSPYNDQRSVVALLADSPRGNELLTNALNDSGKRAAMFGSVAVIRESGVNSLRVGDIYYVGHLPWFERIWFALSNHPILLAIFAAISIVLLAWVLWRMLRIISRRRLSLDDE